MSKRTMLIDSLLPNRAWWRRMWAAAPRDRLKYWALRLGLTILLILIIWVFNIRQHPALH